MASGRDSVKLQGVEPFRPYPIHSAREGHASFRPWTKRRRFMSSILAAVLLLSGWDVDGHAIAGEKPVSAAADVSEPRLPARPAMKAGRLGRAADGRIVLQAAAQRTLRVCPAERADSACTHSELQAAVDAAEPGDTIVLAPGIFEQGAVIDVDRLILVGEPGAHLTGHPVQGKAALVITGAQVVVDGIECSRIQVPDLNGACIRIEGDDLTVKNVWFHDSEQGILSGPGGGTLLIEDSRFERNGRDGYAHGVYIGRAVETFIFRGNRVLSTVSEGHGVKSRARRTIIENNVIAGLDGDDSRAIDIPNGGEVLIRHNVLEKGPNSLNSQMIGLSLEGDPHPSNTAIIEGNLIVFDAQAPGLAQAVDDIIDVVPAKGQVILSQPPATVILRENVIVGAREIGVDTAEGANRMFKSRRAAGLPAYPEVSPSMLSAIPDAD